VIYLPQENTSIEQEKLSQEKHLVRRGKLSLEKAIVCRGRLRSYVWKLKARNNGKEPNCN
jgi:hypothetical protein